MTDLIIGSGADPYIITYQGTYYLIESEHETITIRRAEDLSHLVAAPKEIVWQSIQTNELLHKKQLWAPELHHVNGIWTIVVAASRGRNPTHRSIVLISQSDNPMGPYQLAGKAAPKDDYWAIDMTYLEHNNQLYAVWSGWEHKRGKNRQNIYIALMDSPWSICSERVCLSVPEHHWETSVWAVNEGPQILKKDGQLIGIVYSANASWAYDYTQGLIMYQGGDLLNKSSWKKLNEPISDPNVGHLSFFKHPESGQDWVAYHQKTKTKYGWKDRVIRARAIEWHPENIPNLKFSN